MSEPSAVSEKAVWLDENLVTFFRHVPSDPPLLRDVVNIILARMTPTGVNELYDCITSEWDAVISDDLIAKEIEDMSEDEVEKELEDANIDPASLVERVEKMVTKPEASSVVEAVITGINQAYLAGLKAQKEFDHGT